MSASDKHNILRNILGRGYQSGDEHLFYCPKCDHHKAKLSVNIDKNVFKCWICDYVGTSIYRLVRRYGNHEQRKRWKELDGIVSFLCFHRLGRKPEYVSASSARKACGIKIPKGQKAKQVVLQYLLDNEPQFEVEYTSAGNPKPKYYDIADSIVIARAGQKICQK